MALNDTGGYTIAPDAGPLPKVQPGTTGIPGQAPLGATPYNPNDSSTWTTGIARPGDSFSMSQDDRSRAVTWGQGQSGNRPWENRSASANDTRNNFYYGGTPGGAAAFNGQVYQTGQDLGMGFGRVENNAGFLQKNALALQWSRRVNAAECSGSLTCDNRNAWLQWSRRVNAAECCSVMLAPAAARAECFNGAAA